MTCNSDVTTALLWKNTGAHMTGSVAKNLSIKLSVAKQALIAYHITCWVKAIHWRPLINQIWLIYPR